MNLGFSTFFFIQKPIHEVVDEIVDHGVRTIELSLEIPHLANMNSEFVRRMRGLRHHGVEFSIHAPFFEMNLGSHQEEIREFSRRRVKAAIDMAYSIGANPVVVHPGYTFWMGKIKEIVETSRRHFMKELAAMVSYGKNRGITIALEHIPMHFFFFYDLPEFAELQKDIAHLTMAFDVGHAYVTKRTKGVSDAEGAIMEDVKAIGMGRISHVHLHNNKGKRDDHLFPEGNIDMPRILNFLKDNGYCGKVIIESYEMERKGISPVLEKIRQLGI